MADNTYELATPTAAADDRHFDGWDDEGISLVEALQLLGRRKYLIGIIAAIGTGIAAGVAFLLPNIYTATAVVMPPQKEQSAATALLGQLGPLAAAAGDMGLKSPSDLYVGLLASRTIADRVIHHFQLRAVYRTKTDTDTRLRLRDRAHISSGKDSLIRIEVEDTDPDRAAGIANSFTTELNKLNKSLATTDAGARRAFLETQLGQEKIALGEAENAMKREQGRTGLIQPDAQTSVAIGAVAQLRAQITAGEVAIERLKMGATSQNPELIRAQVELEAMRSQLLKLENGSERGPLPSASALPQAGLDYVRRLRDLKYHELLFELLSKQYEAARLDESKSAPDLQIVDQAVSPDKKSGPNRAAIVLLGCLAGVVVASGAVYLRARLARAAGPV